MRAQAIVLGALVGASCSIQFTETLEGSGPLSSQIRSASDGFTALDVQGPIDVGVEVGGGATFVTVHGHEDLLAHLQTFVDDGELRVRIAPGVRLVPTPRVEVLVPSLEELSLHGSGTVRVTGVHGERFDCTLEGSGSVQVAGHVERLEVERDGSGEADLGELQAERAEVDSEGSGYVLVFVTDELEVDLSGSGRVVYRGAPDVSARTRGSGDVRAVSE